MTSPIIRADHLSKCFKLYARPSHRLIEWASLNRVQRHQDFFALRDVGFSVNRGQCLGIVGSNGSGKSTLLKILTGTLTATSGTYAVDGRVLALLELGTGFNRELTGSQNIRLSSQLLGLEKGYTEKRFDQIAQFAGLGDFLDRPIKLYSSGMLVRLGFSLFAFLEPDVFIVDEALAVGDAAFQRKCYRRLEEMVSDEKRAVILVTHDIQSITRFCTHALWLDKGQVRQTGEPRDVVQAYLKYAYQGSGSGTSALPREVSSAPAPVDLPRFDQLLRPAESAIFYPPSGASVLGMWLEDSTGKVIANVNVDQPFTVCYAIRLDAAADHPVFGIRIATIRGDVLISTNSRIMAVPTRAYSAGDTQIVRWPILPGLTVGEYFISCGCSRDHDDYFLARHVDAYRLSVVGQWRSSGLCALAQAPLLDQPDGSSIDEPRVSGSSLPLPSTP
jgi:ABC-type polysaccharide/polyol phosphate transport system ATPase subunit